MILHGKPLFVGTGFQAHHITGMIIDHGQRMAVHPIDQRHVAFEVHLPQQIWSFLLEAMPRIWRRALRRFDPAVPAQDLMHRGGYWYRQSLTLQAMRDLARAPGWMRIAHRQHSFFNRCLAASRNDMRSPRAIDQFAIAGLPARQPLVADIGADTEPPA